MGQGDLRLASSMVPELPDPLLDLVVYTVDAVLEAELRCKPSEVVDSYLESVDSVHYTADVSINEHLPTA